MKAGGLYPLVETADSRRFVDTAIADQKNNIDLLCAWKSTQIDCFYSI